MERVTSEGNPLWNAPGDCHAAFCRSELDDLIPVIILLNVMLTTNLRRLLIITAALLTVTGSLSVFDGSDEPLSQLYTEAEETQDAEEGEREGSAVLVWVPIFEVQLSFSMASGSPTLVEFPIVCGLHHQRGPPLA